MAEQHTIEQLEAMPDGELAELAARLRGWTLGGLLGKEEIDVWRTGEKPPFDNYELQIRVSDWNPAADIAQAYGLLVWAMERDTGIEFHIHLMRRRSKTTVHPCVSVCSYGMSGSQGMYEVSGIDARAMVYAFVLAMQEAING